MFRIVCTWALLLAAAGSARADNWADGLFEEKSFDFGAVPRGQTLTHPFRVVNKTDKTVQIDLVRVSCGMCSAARALQSTLAPGQETVIVAQMFTSRFASIKDITIYVRFSQPSVAEARLTIQANSRDDLSFNPESLAFGKVKKGEAPTASMTVTFYGTSAQILEAKSDSNYVQINIKEARRDIGDANFQLDAKIRPDTPAGKWYTDIWLKTNNPAIPKLRVPLTVEIEAALSISPKAVSLGEVKAGTEADRKVIIRGATPFKITKITGTDDQVQVREAKAESKSVHILTVTLRPNAVGELQRTLRVHTDLQASSEIEFQAIANIVP
jgi:hypothetical protein